MATIINNKKYSSIEKIKEKSQQPVKKSNLLSLSLKNFDDKKIKVNNG